MKNELLIFIFLLVSFLGFSQKNCSNTFYHVSPELNSHIQEREDIVLTVVVHVLWKEESDNISEEQIKAQLYILNQDFNNQNPRLDMLPNEFATKLANVGVSFCLANVDPQGNPTTGITRRETQVNQIGLTDQYYQYELGGQDAWDPQSYINIWVADFGDSQIQGFATFPDEVGANKDGLVMNNSYFGLDLKNDPPQHLGNSTTHEMGHYFGLNHLWGATQNSCLDDDGLDDTPFQYGPTIGCPTFPKPDNCTQGNGILFMNFMDYTDDACMYMFTKDQKHIIHSTLSNQRSNLLENKQCLVHTNAHKTETTLYPNPTIDYFTFEDPAYRICLYSTQGTLLKMWENVPAYQQISIQEWPAGIYFVQIAEHTYKLVKL